MTLLIRYLPVVLVVVVSCIMWLKQRRTPKEGVPPPTKPVPDERLQQIWSVCAQTLRLVAEFKRVECLWTERHINTHGRCGPHTEHLPFELSELHPHLNHHLPLLTAPQLSDDMIVELWRRPVLARGNETAAKATHNDLWSLFVDVHVEPYHYTGELYGWTAWLFQNEELEVLVCIQPERKSPLDRFYRWLWFAHLEPYEAPVPLIEFVHPGTAQTFRPELDQSLPRLTYITTIGPYTFKFTVRGTLDNSKMLGVGELIWYLMRSETIRRVRCADGTYATLLQSADYEYEVIVFMEVTDD